jgi:hypothetical protein
LICEFGFPSQSEVHPSPFGIHCPLELSERLRLKDRRLTIAESQLSHFRELRKDIHSLREEFSKFQCSILSAPGSVESISADGSGARTSDRGSGSMIDEMKTELSRLTSEFCELRSVVEGLIQSSSIHPARSKSSVPSPTSSMRFESQILPSFPLTIAQDLFLWRANLQIKCCISSADCVGCTCLLDRFTTGALHDILPSTVGVDLLRVTFAFRVFRSA